MSKPVKGRCSQTRRTPFSGPTTPKVVADDSPGRPAREAGSVRHRLARLLDSASLARVVPHLAPETLHQLIQYRGLDASADLLSAVTPAQLTSVLDLDLWRPAEPSGDVRFDPGRFGEWIETLVQTGDVTAARVVAGMDERLVVAGLSRYVRVFDPAVLFSSSSLDGEAAEVAGSYAGLAAEVGGYVVRGRTADAWDAIVALLVALEADHRDRFHAVMRGCRRLSSSVPEIDGLDDLQRASAQLVHDVATEREERRATQGYLTPADARAFLQMARQPGAPVHAHAPAAAPTSPSLPVGPAHTDPIAAAYLNVSEPAAPPESPSGTSGAADTAATTASEAVETIGVLTELLVEAGVVPGRPRALLAAPGDATPTATRLQALLEHARHADEAAWLARGREMAFLANCLLAGCSVRMRPFSVAEATDAVAATCELGLEHWPTRWPGHEAPERAEVVAPGTPLQQEFLVSHDLVTAFQVGWAVLHEMSLSAAARLMAALGELHVHDVEIAHALHVLRRELSIQCGRGTPWRARDPLDVIATLDVATWTALLGLLDECPVIPEALPAAVEGRKGAVSATAFAFVSTTRQLEQVRAFLEKLPDLLIR